jgi:hypothetical protein
VAVTPDTSKAAARPNAARARPYQPPRLVRYGDLRSLVRTKTLGNTDDDPFENKTQVGTLFGEPPIF